MSIVSVLTPDASPQPPPPPFLVYAVKYSAAAVGAKARRMGHAFMHYLQTLTAAAGRYLRRLFSTRNPAPSPYLMHPSRSVALLDASPPAPPPYLAYLPAPPRNLAYPPPPPPPDSQEVGPLRGQFLNLELEPPSALEFWDYDFDFLREIIAEHLIRLNTTHSLLIDAENELHDAEEDLGQKISALLSRSHLRVYCWDHEEFIHRQLSTFEGEVLVLYDAIT